MGTRPRIPDGALPANIPDPMQHTSTDLFWWKVDAYFAPITREAADMLWHMDESDDVSFPREVPEVSTRADTVNGRKSSLAVADPTASTSGGVAVTKRDPTAASGERLRPLPPASRSAVSSELNHMRTYPLTHRLVAALLDERRGGPYDGGASAAKASARVGAPHEPFWLPAVSDVRGYYEALEARVSAELRATGLLHESLDGGHDALAGTMALQHFHANNTAGSNFTWQRRMMVRAAKEIATQDEQRARKRRRDAAEIALLEHYIKTAPKKQRSRYTKLLTARFPNRTVAETKGTGTPAASPGGIGGKAGSGAKLTAVHGPASKAGSTKAAGLGRGGLNSSPQSRIHDAPSESIPRKKKKKNSLHASQPSLGL